MAYCADTVQSFVACNLLLVCEDLKCIHTPPGLFIAEI